MRIAIVNDVSVAVEALSRVIRSVPEYQIAWIAEDGDKAVRNCSADVPDLILMDLMMPRMDGAEATRKIMKQSPCAILVVTATVEGHTAKVFEAMGCGALDVVKTPSVGLSNDLSGAEPLLAKIRMLQRIIGPGRKSADEPLPVEGRTFPLIVIGASTGGPAALAQVIGGLSPDLHGSVVIVQHVDEQFAGGMASWLTKLTGRQVTTIREHDRSAAGRILMAATNDHLVLTKNLTYKYTAEPADYAFRPSVDVFFKSVVDNWTGPVIGVLLTGMGSDGANGLLNIRQSGWHTIAQDQNTSVVYGIPKEAAKLGAAVEILPIDQIASAINNAVRIGKSRPLARRKHK